MTRLVLLVSGLTAGLAAAAPFDQFNVRPLSLAADAGVVAALADGGVAVTGPADAGDLSFAYLNGLGTEGRTWEVVSETAFGTQRILTERLELGLGLALPGKTLIVVGRVGVGIDGAVNARLYALQGMTGSLGIRYQSPTGAFSIEVGARLIPGWGGPNDKDPSAQALALGATQTSAAADDARWLPVSTTGTQLYAEIQSRTDPFRLGPFKLCVGSRYGGQASLAPIAVNTWLGPEPQFLANAYLEGYVGVASIRSWNTRLALGANVNLSLSSIWPSDVPIPFMVDGFVGWSPKDWLVLRVFTGFAGSAGSRPGQLQYGLRLQFYVP